MIIPKPVTFEEAIALTQSLMSQMETGELQGESAEATSPLGVGEAIAQLVKSENGARGFFVTYLTSEGTLADHASKEVIQALQASPDIVAELLVKNLAMSSAMAVTHRRENNEQMAQGSDRVRMRTTRLIEQVELPKVRELALALRESAVTGAGTYKTFLQTWGYDAEQRKIIYQALDRVLPEFPETPNPEIPENPNNEATDLTSD
ncbi:hypothetical protein AVDCRST_MAG92-4996 [uncultured Coleofasciculus sp.]|uniref:Uncharacterized protein n=1 Tax=uncultured Coleofasciculus sp. TaxID=1267456 RepID=A0A6J4K9A6_9CYAN|nr:hypothetical protein AVDCRST_MAG92-4996 [uncultured Coleofasciculus sp.]